MAVSESVHTYQDMLDYCVDILDGGQRTKSTNFLAQVITGALNDLYLAHEWQYYLDEHRVTLSANYDTGTIEFDLTGHADSERALVITTGTWPSWAKRGRVRIGDIVYIVEDTVTANAAVLKLDETFSPVADVAAGTSYNLFRSVYTLPDDFMAFRDSIMVENNYWITHYISPSEWLRRERYWQTTSQTWAWTIMRDPDELGRWAVWTDPSPDAADPLGFIFRRRPRRMRWKGTESTARVTVNDGTTAVGDSTVILTTTLPQNMVGSVIRFHDDTTNWPTGLSGQYPYLEQQQIKSISGTTVTFEGTTTYAITDTSKAVVTDYIDLHETMLEAFKAGIELRLHRSLGDRMKTATSMSLYKESLRLALENESMYRDSFGSVSRYTHLFKHLAGQITTEA